jgi:hypothetical protein
VRRGQSAPAKVMRCALRNIFAGTKVFADAKVVGLNSGMFKALGGFPGIRAIMTAAAVLDQSRRCRLE